MSNILDNNDNYRFLPTELRDFHTQKKLIQTIYRDTNYDNLKLDSYYKISWTQMHVNVVDIFLYNIALRGYCLKRDNRFKTKELFDYDESKKDYTTSKIQDEEVKYIAKARALMNHIDTYTVAETEVKVKCMNVLINTLEENNICKNCKWYQSEVCVKDDSPLCTEFVSEDFGCVLFERGRAI